jgi:hypothetical protein
MEQPGIVVLKMQKVIDAHEEIEAHKDKVKSGAPGD